MKSKDNSSQSVHELETQTSDQAIYLIPPVLKNNFSNRTTINHETINETINESLNESNDLSINSYRRKHITNVQL